MTRIRRLAISLILTPAPARIEGLYWTIALAPILLADAWLVTHYLTDHHVHSIFQIALDSAMNAAGLLFNGWQIRTILRSARAARRDLSSRGKLEEARGVYAELMALQRKANALNSKRNARFIIQLLQRGPGGEALLGCLEEGFTQICIEHGYMRARLWYWFQVFISLRPQMWAALVGSFEVIRKFWH